jgi:hypothetical protein
MARWTHGRSIGRLTVSLDPPSPRSKSRLSFGQRDWLRLRASGSANGPSDEPASPAACGRGDDFLQVPWRSVLVCRVVRGRTRCRRSRGNPSARPRGLRERGNHGPTADAELRRDRAVDARTDLSSPLRGRGHGSRIRAGRDAVALPPPHYGNRVAKTLRVAGDSSRHPAKFGGDRAENERLVLTFPATRRRSEQWGGVGSRPLSV